MRRWLVVLLSLVILTNPSPAPALSILTLPALTRIKSNKILRIEGQIDGVMTLKVIKQIIETRNLPGDRVVIINSPGGFVSQGQKIIDLLESERKATGGKLVCIVTEMAASMAFNLFTRCDVRYMSGSGMGMFHAIYFHGQMGQKWTAKTLREAADDLKRLEEPYRAANAKALGMSLEEYDRHNDAEKEWSAAELLKIGYLDGYAEVIED